jgi:UPF0755 protein
MKNDFVNKVTALFIRIKVVITPYAEKIRKAFMIAFANILPYLKKAYNNAVPFIKRISIWTADFIKWFYKNKIVPLAILIRNRWNDFVRSSKPDALADNKRFLNSTRDELSALAYFGKLFAEKLSGYCKRTYELIKDLLSRKKTFSAVHAKSYTPAGLGFPGNLIRHIKYISYKRLAVYILAFVMFDLLLIWFGAYRAAYARHYWEGTEDKKFYIRPGKNLDDIIGELKEKNILKSKLIFKIYVKFSGKEDKIISKGYIFKSGINNSELLNLLTDKNMVQTEKFTVIEGLRIKQIARNVENKLQLSAERFIKETENDSLINILGLKGKINNLEGFLFPDTYYLPLDIDEKGLVNFLFNEFRKKVLNDEELSKQIKDSRFSLLQVVTLASIIQGETNLKDEMPVVSGVYQNRLRKNMRLEADPTIQYVIPDGPKPRLKYSDLKIDSPYNTYLHFGLPPGPINNPGLSAIKSVLRPDKNNYIFFVATGNGGHKFSETYAEHLKAVEEYKKNLEKKSEQ